MHRIPATLFLLLSSTVISAAPALQMHVFESDQPAMSTTVLKHNLNDGQLSPARKHRLQTHVFEHATSTSTNQNAIRSVTQSSQAPVLAYQTAEFYLNTGYRRDKLDWNTGLYFGTPNILSELKWDNLKIATINVGTTLLTPSNWVFNVDFVYGNIFSGKNQDSDYQGNNRTLEFSRSNNNADKGMVIDGSVYAGHKWLSVHNDSAALYLTPKIGLSYHAQFLRMTDGNQTFSRAVPEFGIPEAFPLGPFSGLNSTYDAAWYGPWIGLAGEVSVSKSINFYADFEYHYAFFDATADWNLRSERAHPESFTHKARGYGLVGSVGGNISLSSNLSLNASLDIQKWKANKDGVRTLFLADGSSSQNVKFNEVNWHSFGANLGITYEF